MGREGKVVAVRLASGAHGGFDSVGLLHPMSSCVVRRLRSDRPTLSVSGPLVAAEVCTARSESSKRTAKRRMGNVPTAETDPMNPVRSWLSSTRGVNYVGGIVSCFSREFRNSTMRGRTSSLRNITFRVHKTWNCEESGI